MTKLTTKKKKHRKRQKLLKEEEVTKSLNELEEKNRYR